MIDEIYNYRHGSLPTVKVTNEWETLCIKFEEELTEEQHIMFHKLFDLQSVTSVDEARMIYKIGFKDGVALMREVQE